MTQTIISYSENDTQQLAKRIADVLQSGEIIALHGNLGAGKTVFSRGFARGLGITEPVTSPTFTIAQEYPCQHNGCTLLYHLDMYRIDDSDSAIAFGIDEYLYNPHAIALIEWPERIPDLLDDPQRIFHITIDYGEQEEQRQISIPQILFKRLQKD